MIEPITIGVALGGVAGMALFARLWRSAASREKEALYLRDNWRELAEKEESHNKGLRRDVQLALKAANDRRRELRLMNIDLTQVRTDNQVLENTVIAKKNEIEDVKVLHQDIERDLGRRCKTLMDSKERWIGIAEFGAEKGDCYLEAIRHLSGELDRARANDQRDPKTGRFVSRRPQRGTGRSTK